MTHHAGPSTSTLNNWYEEPSEKMEHNLPKSVPLSPTTTLQHTPYSSDQDREHQRRMNRQSVFGEIPTTAFGGVETYPAEHPEEEPRSEYKVTRIARRIHGWTWQAYPIGMGTSAVYVTMSGLRDRSDTLRIVEHVFFFLNVGIFFLNLSTLFLQAILYPRQAKRLVTDSGKNIFIPLMILSFATIIIGIINYGVTPGVLARDAAYILFWVYVSLAVGISFPLLMIWYNQPHDVRTMSPAWMFLVFPMMLVGVVAFNVLKTMDPTDDRALGVLFVGYFFQGIGFFVTMFYICIYFLRIMMTGFMEGHQANGVFVAAGPPGFTALALINLGQSARSILPAHGLVSDVAGEVWYASSLLTALMLYGLAVFLFLFGALPYWFKLHKHLNEILGCWALTFPNVGWINTLRALGDIFNLEGFYTVHLIMTILMCLAWIVLIVLTIMAFSRGLIFYAKEEDVLMDSVDPKVVEEVKGMRESFGSSTSTLNSAGLGGPSRGPMEMDVEKAMSSTSQQRLPEDVPMPAQAHAQQPHHGYYGNGHV